jgi:hypothetical protein
MLLTPSMVRLLNTFIFLTWVWHVLSCLYWWISSSEGLGRTSWTPDTLAVDNYDLLNYFLSMVWTIQTTFSCSPQGAPETLSEAVFTIFAFVMGCVLCCGVCVNVRMA